MFKILLSLLLIFSLCLGSINIIAQQISLQTVATGFSDPVDIRNAGDDRLFIVEKGGVIKILHPATGNVNPIPFFDNSILILSNGERGLLSMAFSPDYSTNGYFYVNYSDLSGNTNISRYRVNQTNPDVANMNSEVLLLTINQPFGNNNGGNLTFGPDGYLYIGMGDGGGNGDQNNLAQNPLQLLGKMLRIDVGGAPPYTSPSTNPFFGNPAYKDEIWATGLKNPWRFSFDRLKGDLWISDVGLNLEEEINFQASSSSGGENYGWRCYQGNQAYNTSGCQAPSAYVNPVHVYPHNGPVSGCAITGGYVYRGAQYASLFGRYFFGDHCSSLIGSLTRDNNGVITSYFHGNFGPNSFTSFGEDLYGELFLASLSNGSIYRVRDTSCAPTAFITFEDSVKSCGSSYPLTCLQGANLSYQWYRNGNLISGANQFLYQATLSGNYHVVVTNASFCQNASAAVYLTLNPLPSVNISGLDTFYCVNASQVIMGGTPSGGVFSGPGVFGNTFVPVAAGVGIHAVSYSFTDNNGCKNSSIVNVEVGLCTGIETTSHIFDVIVYPVAENGELEIEFLSLNNSGYRVMIHDILGRVAIETKIVAQSGFNKVKFDVQETESGLYFLSLMSEDFKKVIRFYKGQK